MARHRLKDTTLDCTRVNCALLICLILLPTLFFAHRSFRPTNPPWPVSYTPSLNHRYTSHGGIITIPFDVFERSSLAQDVEDVYLARNFYPHNDTHAFLPARATFLELGALDGNTFANTFALESLAHWRGVLVEANPRAYRELVLNRPHAVCVHAAICAPHASVDFVHHPGTSVEPCPSQRTRDALPYVHYLQHRHDDYGAVDGILEFMSEDFFRHFYSDLHHVDASTCVACTTLDAVLHWLPASAPLQRDPDGRLYIDYFSLDVEGAELQVLHSLDFDRVHFYVISVEAGGTNTSKDAAVRDLLISQGYIFHSQYGRSDWFVG
ncbi:hypothetical protein CDCA_CDCA04G1383 [Cyanidium caldarium]|uniref:Methyltransferase FkbM domain-containing protein n=1 Tax=Cyanidium caldarium TaxID=2771 RepID=A0AAV9ITF4_CYACA|nr:hypothetical protein CDCA_CDCA04G1383 [Cyanidium caldarium]